MRISDWSSDVCSSDLARAEGTVARHARPRPVRRTCLRPAPPPGGGTGCHPGGPERRPARVPAGRPDRARQDPVRLPCDRRDAGDGTSRDLPDRKSVVKGKSVSVSVEPGGCRILKKKKLK